MNKEVSGNSLRGKVFWEKVYMTKTTNETGWFQKVPEVSLDLIKLAQLSKDANIIDVGGGDSLLVDHLLDLGYNKVTVLDISEKSLNRAKERLGQKASKVRWICSDITRFDPIEKFDLWHDRACLHFLTHKSDLELYKKNMLKSISRGGEVIIGTFSKTGPEKCSGLPIHQYDSSELNELFSSDFELMESFDKVHLTPSQIVQNYVFCRFKRN